MTLPIRRILILLALTAALPARAGSLSTRAGETLEGDLTLADDAVSIRLPSGKSRSFPLDQITHAVFSQASLPAGNGHTTKPRAEHANPAHQVPRRILAEYFTDATFKQRVLARFESSIQSFWTHNEPPESAIPPRCAVRYTFQFLPKASEIHRFVTDTNAGVRLWVGERLLIDAWEEGRNRRQEATLELKAKEPVDVRLEVKSSANDFLARLFIKASYNGAPYFPTEMIRPPKTTNLTPEVALVSPADTTYYVNPPSITLEAKASDPDGQIASVEFLADHRSIGLVTRPPYTFVWKNPTPGNIPIRAKVTDDKGLCEYSLPRTLNIAGTGADKTLPAPWGDLIIQDKSHKNLTAASATFADGKFTLTRAGGQVTEGNDAFLYVFQPVKGDFSIVARLQSLAPLDNQVSPLAGLMIRDSAREASRFAAVLTGIDNTLFLRRTDTWSKPTVNDRSQLAPCWIRLVRHGNRLRGYVSPDGKDWGLLGTEKLELAQTLMVGLCAMSRNEEKPATAVFDHVAITPGVPPMTYAASGIHLRGGTFLAAQIDVLRDNNLYYERNGKAKLTIPIAEVARVVFQPVAEELFKAAPSDQTGVLLASGDFAEGTVKEISYRVMITSPVLGPRAFHVRTYHEVLTANLRPLDPAKARYTVHAADGSVFRAKSLTLTPQSLNIDDACLGQITLPAADLLSLKSE